MTTAATAASQHERLLVLFEGRRLSPTQRRIAHFLLHNLPTAAFMSSVELAENVGVSQPSVTRFAVALGLSGYPALRAALRQIALGTAAGTATPGADGGNALQAAVAAEMANLEALRESLGDPAAVLALGRDLAASSPLAVLGQRVSEPLARYFGYAARRIHPDVRCVTEGGTAALDAVSQARAAGGQWLLAFAMPRYAAETVRALRFARQLGLRTAVVTDVPFVPFAAVADVLLPAPAGSGLVFDSYAAPVVLAAVLLHAMADADPARTRARLEAYDRASRQHGFFAER
jgi:DNA-binding MurR/RpiR family transcriptional regulator